MNEYVEHFWIDVFDGDRITLGWEVLPEFEGDDKKEACRVGEILAKAIGREIGAAFKDDEEMAVKIAARLSYAILGEISEVLENAEN